MNELQAQFLEAGKVLQQLRNSSRLALHEEGTHQSELAHLGERHVERGSILEPIDVQVIQGHLPKRGNPREEIEVGQIARRMQRQSSERRQRGKQSADGLRDWLI